MADPGGREDLQRDHRKAAIVAAQRRFSYRLGNFVRSDGDQRGTDLFGSGLPRQVTEFMDLFDPAGVQFLLEHHFFQLPELRICTALAGGTVGADFVDDPVLPNRGSSGGLAAGALLPVGDVCRLSEFWRVAAQHLAGQKRKEKPCRWKAAGLLFLRLGFLGQAA